MTRKKMIAIIAILLVALILYEIVAYIPYLMMGSPFGVFGINNMDSKSHNINVQGVMDTWSSAHIEIDNYGNVHIEKIMG